MEKCFGNNKNVLFLNLKDKIIEQEINKMAIHANVIFRSRNAMFFLLKKRGKNIVEQDIDKVHKQTVIPTKRKCI